MTSAFGNMEILSFNCHKTIQCGEGGAVLTNDDVLADRLRLVRNHGEVVLSQRGMIAPELAGLLGYNYRLTELQSAVALAQIRRLEELTVGRIASKFTRWRCSIASSMSETMRSSESKCGRNPREGSLVVTAA